MAPMLPIEVVLTVVVIIVALVFAHFHALLVKPESESEKAEPMIQTTEPNRRNQSATPPATPARQPHRHQHRRAALMTLTLDPDLLP